MGKLNDFQLEIHVDNSVKPVIQPVRRILFHLREKLGLMPRSHIHGLDAGLATDVHSWQSVLVSSFQNCIRKHT